MKDVGIIGRGALGILYGTLLSEYCNVFYIVDDKRKERYLEHPVKVNNEIPQFIYKTEKEVCNVDLLIFAVKYPAMKNAIELARPFVTKDTIMISVLNGIVSEEDLKEAFSKDQVLYAISQGMDAVYLNNTMNYTKTGIMVIGKANDDTTDHLDKLMQFFDECHIAYRKDDDILYSLWNKLMLNCGVNQVCGAYDVGYGEAHTGGKYHQLMIDTMEEVRLCANKEGIALKKEDIDTWCKVIDSLDADLMPSLRQDLLAHRKTERDLFGGTIIKLGNKHHISVPHNTELYHRIGEIEKEF